MQRAEQRCFKLSVHLIQKYFLVCFFLFIYFFTKLRKQTEYNMLIIFWLTWTNLNGLPSSRGFTKSNLVFACGASQKNK